MITILLMTALTDSPHHNLKTNCSIQLCCQNNAKMSSYRSHYGHEYTHQIYSVQQNTDLNDTDKNSVLSEWKPYSM